MRLMNPLARLAWVGPLLGRLTIGAVFVGAGWGKLHNLGNTTEFFTELGIPAPGFHAALVAGTELVGGLAVLLGLATRMACLPLAFTMIIATITAKRGDIGGLRDLLALEEFTYLAILLWLALAGAGAASLDRLIARWRTSRTTPGPSSAMPGPQVAHP
jgi:putative oxidoreductase